MDSHPKNQENIASEFCGIAKQIGLFSLQSLLWRRLGSIVFKLCLQCNNLAPSRNLSALFGTDIARLNTLHGTGVEPVWGKKPADGIHSNRRVEQQDSPGKWVEQT